jgi:hypothetical protein
LLMHIFSETSTKHGSRGFVQTVKWKRPRRWPHVQENRVARGTVWAIDGCRAEHEPCFE